MLHATVGSEHLLIGILRVEGCTAMRILAQHGFDVYTVREEVLGIAKEREASQQKKELPFLSEYGRDLTSLATEQSFDPADRPRRRARPHRPDPLPPDQEQPHPSRRAGRRQDRHRRGAGAADHRGAGADLPGQQADRGARPVADRRRHQVPRPVRGAAEGDPERAEGEPGADRLHRRDPLADRRGLGGRVARRRQHPEAGAVARRDLLHRRDDAQGVPQVHREGPLAAAPFPGDPGATRRRRSRRRRSSKGSRTATSPSTRCATARRPCARRSTSRAATSRTATCPTRRSTSSTRRARGSSCAGCATPRTCAGWSRRSARWSRR